MTRDELKEKARDLPLKPGLDHDFVIVKPEMPEAQTIMDEMCDFLRTY